MIKITKNNKSSKVLIFCLSCFSVPIICLYIFLGEHSVLEKLVCGLIILINIFISLRIANQDFDLFIHTSRKEAILKKGDIIKRFDAYDFLNFKIEYIGPYASSIYKFYYLSFKGYKYRIRYYVENLDSYKSLINYEKETKIIESNLKQEILKCLEK